MQLRMVISAALLAVVVALGSSGVAMGVPKSPGSTVPAGPLSAAADASPHPGFASPEEAVAEYLEGVADADIERILRTAAVEEMGQGFQFDLLVERLGAFIPPAPGPVHTPFFADIERAGWTAERLGHVRWLAYSLLAPETLADAIEFSVMTDVDAEWARDLQVELDPNRLSSLEILDIAVPEPELSQGPRYIATLVESATRYGADEQADRVALFTFEGAPHAVGFSLLRYGDGWKILGQSSPISGLPPHGVAQPMTVDEFTELTSE